MCFVLGVVHSILGEYLVFKASREKGRLIPSKASSQLKERHIRIVWATWHLTSIFGWCLAVIIVKTSFDGHAHAEFSDFIVQCITLTMFLSSILVFVGTKGKHPGWIILLAIGILLIIGN